ncbi:unnamed protein product [Cylindrotheca closterium]|uniref:Leucine-rich repeat domain-containing protein n=1 Tax=Cylindrotheca closterium TaxID=2856 RepID=A0AAD2FZC7_9STRA|nr:unnamed protein product [Cylindrotheca closterium]
MKAKKAAPIRCHPMSTSDQGTTDSSSLCSKAARNRHRLMSTNNDHHSTTNTTTTDSTSFYSYDGKTDINSRQMLCQAQHLQVSNKVTNIPDHFCQSDVPLALDLSNAYNLRMIGRSAFQCPSLQTIIWPTTNQTDDQDVGDTSPHLQELGAGAFEACCNLQHLDWSQLLQLISISESCFLACKGLQTIKMAPNLNRIGSQAFGYCKALREIQWNGIPIIELEADLFTACSQLTYLDLTDLKQLRIIGPRVFKNCKGLECVEFPASLETIGMGAFYGCESLKQVKFASDCTAPTNELLIDQAAFAKCTSLSFFDMPNCVTRLAPLTFWGCTNLETLILSPTLESIGGSALGNCVSLKEVTLPSTMNQESIGPNAFFNCPIELGSDIWYWHYPRHENDFHHNIFNDGRCLPSIVTKVKIIISGNAQWYASYAPIDHPNGKEALEWVDIQGNDDLLSAIQLSLQFPKATAATISKDRLIRMYNNAPICQSLFRTAIDDRQEHFVPKLFRTLMFQDDGDQQETRDIMEKFKEIQLVHANTIHQLVSRRVGIDFPFEPFAFLCS